MARPWPVLFQGPAAVWRNEIHRQSGNSVPFATKLPLTPNLRLFIANNCEFASINAACEPVTADRSALQNALQSMVESDRTRLQAQNSDSEKSLVLPLCADICSDMHNMPLLGTGIEPALLSEPEPKSGASASSATRAGMDLI